MKASLCRIAIFLVLIPVLCFSQQVRLTRDADLYSNPTTKIGVLRSGATVNILEKKDNWMKVSHTSDEIIVEAYIQDAAIPNPAIPNPAAKKIPAAQNPANQNPAAQADLEKDGKPTLKGKIVSVRPVIKATRVESGQKIDDMVFVYNFNFEPLVDQVPAPYLSLVYITEGKDGKRRRSLDLRETLATKQTLLRHEFVKIQFMEKPIAKLTDRKLLCYKVSLHGYNEMAYGRKDIVLLDSFTSISDAQAEKLNLPPTWWDLMTPIYP